VGSDGVIYLAALAVFAFGFCAGLAVTLHVGHRRERAVQRTHDRRVDTLLDRLAHAKGREWMPPPADLGPEPEPEEPVYAWAPEQEPDE
jgi:hypothetical protein